MLATEQLRRQISAASELLQVVRTLRAIAVVTLREFELAEAAVTRYAEAVGQGLALTLAPPETPAEQPSPYARIPEDAPTVTRSATPAPLGLVAIGSDHGICGRFNESLVDALRPRLTAEQPARIIVLGARLAARLASEGVTPEAEFPMPKTADAVSSTSGEVLIRIEQWQDEGVDEVVLAHNTRTEIATHEAVELQLLPLDTKALIAEHPWPGDSKPMILGEREPVGRELLDQYLRTIVAQALTRSSVAENEARLLATQGAQRNIEQRIDDLHAEYRHAYQGAETEELLDVGSGFEAITHSESGGPGGG